MSAFSMSQAAFGGALPKGSPPPGAKSPPSERGFPASRKPGSGPALLAPLLACLAGVFPSAAFALPEGHTVRSGAAVVERVSPEKMSVHQSTDKAVIDWRSFNIGAAEHVDFRLSRGGTTLNRVTGNDPSRILGKLTSNGDLWLVNPNGVFFGKNSRVDVRGLVATASNIADSNFMSGNYKFDIPPGFSSSVVNRGTITAAEGGLVALVAPGAQNLGVISARLGKVTLASGKTFTLDLYGDQLVNLGVDSKVASRATGIDGETLSSLVANSGSIFADGGAVRLEVSAARDIVDRAINMDGVVQARSVAEKSGKIILSGGEGRASVSGTLDASGYGAGETGGEVNVLGRFVDLHGSGLIDVSGDSGGGTLLFGGDYQGKGAVPNARETRVEAGARALADAASRGNGGKVIFWADRRTDFLGSVKARGGRHSGNGGFVEVSGKEELFFDGSVDTTAANGNTGTLLFDPDVLRIANGGRPAGQARRIPRGGGTAQNIEPHATIYEETLENVVATTNIILLANKEIIVGDLTDDGILDLKQTPGHTVTFRVTGNPATRAGRLVAGGLGIPGVVVNPGTLSVDPSVGNIRFEDLDDTISTQGGALIFDAKGKLRIGHLLSNGGPISLKGSDLDFNTINSGAGGVTIRSSEADINIQLGGAAPAGCGAGQATRCAMHLAQDELARITAGSLTIGGLNTGGVLVDTVDLGHINNVVISTAGAAGGVFAGSGGGIVFRGAESRFRSLEVTSGNGIEISADITATGALTVRATSSLSLGGGVTLDSAGNLSLTAGRAVSAGDLTLTSTAGTIDVNAPLESRGNVAMTARSGLTLRNSALTAAGDIDLNGGTGGLTLASGMNIRARSITLARARARGSATLTAEGAITLSHDFTAAGAVRLDSGGMTTISRALNAGNNNIHIEAGDLEIAAAGSVTTTGPGGATIRAKNNGPLGLGDFAGGFAGMNLDNGELSRINGNLNLESGTIIAADGAALNLNGRLTVGQAGGTIDGRGAMTLTATHGLTVDSSALTAEGNIILNGDRDGDGTGDLTLASGMNIRANNPGSSITLGGAAIAARGAIDLTAEGGVTLSNDFTAAGAVRLDSGGTTTINGRLTTGNHNLDIEADDLEIAAAVGVGGVNTGTGAAAIRVKNNGRLGLGVAPPGLGGGMTLSFAELGRIATEDLRLISGDITVAAGTVENRNGRLTIGQSGGTIRGQGAMTLAARDGLTVDSETVDAAGNLALEGDSDNAGAGGITLASGATLTSTAGNITLDATHGGVAAQGAVTLTAQGNIALNDDFTAGGAVGLTARGGSFTLAAGQSLNTRGNSLSVTANDAIINGSIDSGAAETKFLTTAGRTIRLGAGGGAGDFWLTDAELDRITAARLVVGDNNNGDITVNGATIGANIDSLILNAIGAGRSITFTGAASSFRELAASAGSGVTLDSGVTTGGAARFSAGAGNFTVNAALSTNNHSLSVTANDIVLRAGSSITSGTAETRLSTTTAGRGIKLGAAAAAGHFSLDNDELDTITAGRLVIGDSNSGDIDGNINTTIGAGSAIRSLSLNSGGSVDVESDSALTLGASTAGRGLEVIVGGDNSLRVEGALRAGRDATLRADDDIVFTADGDITAASEIFVKADNDLDRSGSGGAVTMDRGTDFRAGARITLEADEDITLGLLSAPLVDLESNNGGVRDTNDSGGLDIAAGRLAAELATGFGTPGNAIETSLGRVDIDSSGDGDVNIFESDVIDIDKIRIAGEGNIRVSFFGRPPNRGNAEVLNGTVSFIRRDSGNTPVPGTGKTIKTLTDERTLQFFTVFENIAPVFLAVDRARDDNPELPPLDLFNEAKPLLEADEKIFAYFDGLESLENVWEGAGVDNAQIAERKRNSRRAAGKRLAAKPPEATFERERAAGVSFRKPRRKAPARGGEVSGGERAPYQPSRREAAGARKPLFSLSRAGSL